MSETFKPTPSTVYMGWFYHQEYPDIYPENPDVPSIRTKDRSIRIIPSRILERDRIEF
jgi:hypothetical protein